MSRTIVDKDRSMVMLGGAIRHADLRWEEDETGRYFVAAYTDPQTRDVVQRESTDSMRRALLELDLALSSPLPVADPGPLPPLTPKRALEKAMDREVAPERILRALPEGSALVTVGTLARALQALDAEAGPLPYDAMAEELIRYVRAHP